MEAQLNIIKDIVVKHDKQLSNKEDVNTDDKTKSLDVTEQTEQTEKDDKASDLFDIEGYNNLGNGFYIKDIKFLLYGSSIKATGVVLNAPGKASEKEGHPVPLSNFAVEVNNLFPQFAQ